MNRETFINELKTKLIKLPQEECDAALNYYEEYFDEAGPENEEKIIAELGSPTQIAKQIMADFVIKETQLQTKIPSPKKSMGALWIIIIAIFATPIALPLAIALVTVLFALFITMIALLFAGILSFTAIGISGIALFGIGIATLFIHPATGAFLIGSGLILIGLGIGAGMLVYLAAAKLMPLIARGLGRIFDRIRGVK